MSFVTALLIVAAPAVPDVKAEPVPAAFNQPVPSGKVSTANPRSIVAALQERGYKAVLSMEDGKPYVESGANGGRFYIYLQNCKEQRDCQDVIFTSGYEKKAVDPVGIDAINDFNRTNRWTRAYLDKDGGPVLEMDVLFTNQLIDQKMFEEAVDIWAEMLTSFHKTIDF